MGVFAKNLNRIWPIPTLYFSQALPLMLMVIRRFHYLWKPKFEMLPNEIVPFVIN